MHSAIATIVFGLALGLVVYAIGSAPSPDNTDAAGDGLLEEYSHD